MKAKQNGELSWGVLVPFAALLAVLLACAGALAEDWQSYKPVHSLGSSSTDWWTTYPDQSRRAGSVVEHPQWILESLKEKPVIVFLHQDSCTGCEDQKKNISSVMEMYPQSVVLFDIEADWRDPRFLDFNNTYEPSFVPTTIFLSRARGADGKSLAIWHGEDDVMSTDKVQSFVKDAIFYYQEDAA